MCRLTTCKCLGEPTEDATDDDGKERALERIVEKIDGMPVDAPGPMSVGVDRGGLGVHRRADWWRVRVPGGR